MKTMVREKLYLAGKLHLHLLYVYSCDGSNQALGTLPESPHLHCTGHCPDLLNQTPLRKKLIILPAHAFQHESPLFLKRIAKQWNLLWCSTYFYTNLSLITAMHVESYKKTKL